jgi:hypothetical protein
VSINILALVVILALVEAGLYLLINVQRRSFPWLITERDELPSFDPEALKKFIDNSFDADLGWVRKANSCGIEKGQNGPITYNIDSIGSRVSSLEKKLVPRIAAFGDSYAFCRQVEDDETWEAVLSRQEGVGVLNYGVGNYGLDQSLLRYESAILPSTVKVVIMCFVPETICRIQSYWKHYLEFGNTFAFKPRFILDSKGQIVVLENLIRSAKDFSAVHEKIPEIQKADSFYIKKFRSQQFRFPYTLSLIRNPVKHSVLILSIAIRAIFRTLGISGQHIENFPFTVVMKRNILDAYDLYRDNNSIKLLNAILTRFNDETQRRGHIPLVVVIPQLLDLKLNKNKHPPYEDYYNKLAHYFSVLNLTEKFSNMKFENLYINDQYGGHLSAKGNQLVAHEILNWLKSNT